MSTGTLALIAVGVLVVIGVATGKVWDLFSPADLGDADFATLQRRSSPNDALACPAGLCAAKSDLTPPVFAAPVERLKAALAEIAASEVRTTRVDGGEAGSATVRYVQRSLLMGFPDTIVVRFLPLPEGRSTLAIYSRSKVGYGDMGVNKARIVRWLDKLKARLPVSGSSH